MPLPPSWITRHVVGTYVATDDAVVDGRIIFEPTQIVAIDGVTVLPAAFNAPLAAGAFEIDLPTTDDPGINVRDWCYRVTEAFPGGRSFYLRVPAGAEPLDIATAAPVVDPPAATQLAAVARTGRAADLVGLAEAISAELVDLPLPNAVSKVAGLTGDVATADLQNALGLKPVALSNKYGDLTGLPTIPANISQLVNDAGFLNSETDPTVPPWAKQPEPPTYTKTDVGLGNVDNTSDADKPVSTAQATAIAAKVDTTAIGSANGVAPLDSTGKVPAANLPPAPASGVQSVVAGTNVTVDATDPAHPVVNASGVGAQADWNATGGAAQILNKPAMAVSGIGLALIGTNLNAVVIGAGASATNNNGVAIGTNAVANGGVAIGYGAKSPGTAVGINSKANTTDSLAVGVLASASPQYSIAIGYSAAVAYTNSVAIGALVNATASNQMMLMAAGATVTTGGLFQLSAYTVASLNAMSITVAPVGCVALATDALDVGEAAGAGTGCVALKKASGWVRLADNTPLAT